MGSCYCTNQCGQCGSCCQYSCAHRGTSNSVVWTGQVSVPLSKPKPAIKLEDPFKGYQRGYDDGFRSGYALAKKESQKDSPED